MTGCEKSSSSRRAEIEERSLPHLQVSTGNFSSNVEIGLLSQPEATLRSLKHPTISTYYP